MIKPLSVYVFITGQVFSWHPDESRDTLNLTFSLFALHHHFLSHRPLRDEEGLWDGQMQNASSLVPGMNPMQRYQPTQGNYQLQFAIQQLQQQRQRSHQFLDQDHCRHQVHKRNCGLFYCCFMIKENIMPSWSHLTFRGHFLSSSAAQLLSLLTLILHRRKQYVWKLLDYNSGKLSYSCHFKIFTYLDSAPSKIVENKTRSRGKLPCLHLRSYSVYLLPNHSNDVWWEHLFNRSSFLESQTWFLNPSLHC